MNVIIIGARAEWQVLKYDREIPLYAERSGSAPALTGSHGLNDLEFEYRPARWPMVFRGSDALFFGTVLRCL
jgi:hypothetical protein